MRSIATGLVLIWAFVVAVSAGSWSFTDGQVAVSRKGAGEDNTKEALSASSPVTEVIPFGSTDTLRVSLTATANGKASRPHQAFLALAGARELEASFPVAIKSSGKGSVEITYKDLPVQFRSSQTPLKASLILGSFGADEPFQAAVFSLDVESEKSARTAPTRYGKLEEIHHIFRADPKSPPKIFTAIFTLAIVAALPVLLGTWVAVGGNFSHVGEAFQKSPVSHALFTGSILAMEGVFFLYYTHWTLFEVLPAMAVVGAVAFVSGSKALSEVAGRRVAGKR